MNRPSPKDIEAQALAFDRAHFADGIDPAPGTILRHHEKLKTDPKLVTRLQPRFAVTLGFYEGYTKAIEDLRNEVPEQANIGIVKKPPPPPPPAASLPASVANLRGDLAWGVWEADDRYTEGWRYATKVERERCERIASEVIKRFVKYPVDVGQLYIRAIGHSSTTKKAVAPDELSTEVDDELAKAAAEYANELKGCSSMPNDVKSAREAFTLEFDACNKWELIVTGFISGARWQLTRSENAPGEDPPNVHELRAENERLRKENERFRNELDRLNDIVSRDFTPVPSPIVFRDEQEREYWDGVTFMLARKGDTTSQSVSRAADEMVEERRARMPLVRQVRDELREPSNGASGVDAFTMNDKICVMHGGNRMEFGIDAPRFTDKSVKEIATIIRSELPSKHAEPTEVTNELLLEADMYANTEMELNAGPSNLETAKRAVDECAPYTWPWGYLVRVYVAGALRKARKT